MKKSLHALARNPLHIVEFEGDKPVRLIDIEAHIKKEYADVTLGELWTIARAHSKQRREKYEEVVARLAAKLSRRPTWDEIDAEPELKGHDYLDSGGVKRAGPLSTRIADWELARGSYGQLGNYDEDVLKVLLKKTGDPLIQLYFDMHYRRE